MPLDLKRERTLSLVPATGSIAESGPGDAVPATTSGEWQVDLVPIPMDWDSPTRAVLGLVVDRSGLVLAGEALDSPSGETPDVVDRMAALLDETIEAVGHRPSLVRVRHPTVRAGLAPILASFGIQVRTARKLPQLDRVRHDFAIGALGMEDSSLAGVSTCAWSAWGIDAAVVGDLFAAAVEFWEAAPWSRLPADEEFGAIVPGSSRWSLLVMGAADETFGIALLESGADAERLLRDETPGSLGAVRNMGLALLLPRTADLPRAVKADVKRHRWPVPHGRLPMLHTINTPAGGVTHSQIVDLTAILRAVVSLASAVQAGRVGTDGSALWSEPGSGVNFLVNPATLVLWSVARAPDVLRTACAEGSGADPMARVDVGRSDAELDQELAAVAGFANWPTTSARPRGSPASTKTGRHADVRIAHRFIRFLVEQQRVPLRAVSEFDLRVYLDDVLNQDDFRTAKPAVALLASLGRFFAYLAARTSAPISCPWAESVLDELAAFDQRRRGISELFFHGGSVAHCRQAMYDALTARLLVANILVSDSDLVTAWAGPFEREVEYQVQRLWLVWRDEIIRSETTRRDAVLRALCGRQARWEATPNPSVKGRTPREVIEAERRVFTPEFPMAKPSRAPKSHR